ncbi:MAG: IclR family transcriptional regulator [Betaproteobacteria bacterium]|nr:IclR family transcriptional regulator [Betaproteobacteria bacterium]
MAKRQGAPRKPARAAEPGPVRAVQRAFDLLAHLGDGQPAPTLSALARSSGLAVSTVARLLAALEHAGFVHRVGAGYEPGRRLVQMGLSALRRLDVFELAEPHLRRLSAASGETANLATRADAEHAIYLRQVVSPKSIHHASWLGRMLPVARTAVGQALAGNVNATGYIARKNTLEPDVTAIAAPIWGAAGEIAAALSITGPSYRISEADIRRYGTLVAEEARLASEVLGARLRAVRP